MTKKITNFGCQIPDLNKSNNRVLFAKPICNTYEQAIALLKARNLGPGDVAVVRYYLNNENSEWDDPTGLPIRMIMGIGGTNAQADDDVYIFNDSRIDGKSCVTADDVEAILIELLNDYVTKDDIKQIHATLKADEAWKELVNNSFEENTNDHENFSRDIDELRSKLNNIDTSNPDLSNYYTKHEIDNMFDNIELDQYYTKNEITEILETKVDSSYVENYFETNVENTVNQIIKDKDIPGIVEEEIANQNINQQVSDAVDEKLKDFNGVTTETIDEALQNNEYFTTNVITPITQLETTVKELVDASMKVDNIDGEEMEEWVLE